MSGDQAGWDDALHGFGRELRHGIGDELRADAEEGERLAAQAGRRRAALADVARAAMFRGDRVAFRYAGHQVVGEVLHAAGDLATVATPAGRTHCHLAVPVTFEVLERDVGAGRTPEPGIGSFRARMLQLELGAAEVEVRSPTFGGSVRGRLAVVATDHLVVATGASELHVALPAVDAVAEVRSG